MTNMGSYRQFYFSAFVVLFFSIILPAAAEIKVFVNEDIITSLDIKHGLKRKLSGSKKMRKEMQQALMKQFKSPSTRNRLKALFAQERPRTKEEANKIKSGLARQIQREVANRYKRKYTPRLRKNIVNDLIDDLLKYQAVKKNNMLLTEEEMSGIIKNIASRNKHRKTGKPLTVKQLKQELERGGQKFEKFRHRLRVNYSWRRYINSKFGRQVSVSEKQIQAALARQKNGASSAAKKAVEKILKVSFSIPQKTPESGRAKRFAEADTFRQSVTECLKISQKAVLQPNVEVKYLDNGMQHKKVRDAVRDRQKGQLSTPVEFKSFIALYAKCGDGSNNAKKIAGTVNDARHKKAEKQLKVKEIARLAKRHLRDLKQDANIRYR